MGAAIVKVPYRILGASSGAVSAPADTTEDILASVTVPAGMMGLNGILRWSAIWTFTNSANTKTLRMRFGGIGGTVYMTTAPSTTNTYTDFRYIQNNNSASAQVGGISAVTASTFNLANNANVTSSVDTSADTTLVFTGQKTVAGETITLASYLVELITP